MAPSFHMACCCGSCNGPACADCSGSTPNVWTISRNSAISICTGCASCDPAASGYQSMDDAGSPVTPPDTDICLTQGASTGDCACAWYEDRTVSGGGFSTYSDVACTSGAAQIGNQHMYQLEFFTDGAQLKARLMIWYGPDDFCIRFKDPFMFYDEQNVTDCYSPITFTNDLVSGDCYTETSVSPRCDGYTGGYATNIHIVGYGGSFTATPCCEGI